MPGGKSISVSSQLFVVRGLLTVGFISMLMVSAVGELHELSSLRSQLE